MNEAPVIIQVAVAIAILMVAGTMCLLVRQLLADCVPETSDEEEEDESMTFGQQLREIRLERGHTVEFAAAALLMKTTVYLEMERGEFIPDRELREWCLEKADTWVVNPQPEREDGQAL